MTTDHVAADEIAVVGMAGRFPGAPDVASLWHNLLAGVDSVHDHTDDELRAMGLREWLIADPTLVRGAGRLDGVADFDADFFGVPAAEAALLDPQHRLFLEQSWVALQDAGPPDPSVVVGVFAGCSTNRYFLFHLLGNPTVSGAPADDREAQLVVGAAPDYLPAQVAYRLGTTGPAIAVQTACSSSLVAVCTAAQNLLDYRCDLALAGGVSVTEPRFRHTPGGLVSPDGRCRAFDAAGLGSGYGSGVAVLALRRLADALADGDRVYAVLHGWAVNNDGSTRAGFAAPGLDGQASVVAEALACASLSGEDIGYVEAHGSGTLLGDAIELAALRRAFGPAAGCAVGSLRTNLGNLDAAAGAAGLIKAVLAVREGMIPASLHHTSPNPQADFAGFSVPTATTAWTGDGPRLAGVSSFGLGGTNAHVIVGEPPAPEERGGPPPWVLLPVSARTTEALREVVTALRAHLAAAPPDSWLLADVAHTLATRTAFRHRAAFPAADPAGALAALDTWLADASPSQPSSSPRPSSPSSGPPQPSGPAQPSQAARPEVPVELVVAAREWTSGGDPVVTVDGARRVWLPPYPFQRTRHWIEAP